MATTRLVSDSRDDDLRTLRNWCSTAKQPAAIFEMCGDIVRPVSIQTSRSRTMDAGVKALPQTKNGWVGS
jgi:hypothetical protein